MRRKRTQSFTLVEMLIVVSLVSVISISLSTAIINGAKIWFRVNRLVVEEDIALVIDRLNLELRSTFRLTGIEFKGRERTLSFATHVPTKVDARIAGGKTEYTYQMGRAQYSFNREKKKFLVEYANYGLTAKNVFFPGRVLLRDVEDVVFEYFYFDDTKTLTEAPEVDDIPAVVKVTIVYKDDKGRRRSINRVISIPVGA